MKIALLGSQSFLARYCRQAWQKESLLLCQRHAPEEEGLEFEPFDYPERLPPLETLLRYPVIIYFASAGVQAGKNTPPPVLYGLNCYYPIQLALSLKEADYRGTFITFGSYFELGNNAPHHAATEAEVATANGPVPNHYCASKRMLTTFYESQTVQSFTWYHLILPTIYGPGEQSHRLLPYLAQSFAANQAPSLTSGAQTRQYLYAGDAARLLPKLWSDSAPPAGLYNVEGAFTTSIKALAESVRQRLGAEVEPQLGQTVRKDTAMNYLELQGEKLRNALGNFQHTPLAEVLPGYLSPAQ